MAPWLSLGSDISAAEVKNGVLHGEIGARGAANWYELNGKIMANGTAILRTTGTTGNNPAYTDVSCAS